MLRLQPVAAQGILDPGSLTCRCAPPPGCPSASASCTRSTWPPAGRGRRWPPATSWASSTASCSCARWVEVLDGVARLRLAWGSCIPLHPEPLQLSAVAHGKQNAALHTLLPPRPAQVCNHPDLFEPRPIISAFDMVPGLEFRVPGLVACNLLSLDQSLRQGGPFDALRYGARGVNCCRKCPSIL